MSKYLGNVSAYALAVSQGYQGTEEEFAVLMASYASVAQQAIDAKNDAVQAKDAAVAAKDTAVGAKDTAVRSKDTAVQAESDAENAKNDAVAAQRLAKNARDDAQAEALKSEGYAVGTQNGTAVPATSPYYHNNSKWYSEQAGTSANTASDKAGEASQFASDADQAKRDAVAAKDRAEAVAESLPADYTQMSEDVAELKEKIEQKANIDGNYKDLTAGSADQLVSTQYHEDQEPYLYRTSGGSTDIGDLENDTIVGGSVVWNQLADNATPPTSRSGMTISPATGGFTIDGTASTATSMTGWFGLSGSNNNYLALDGHKVLVAFELISGTINPASDSSGTIRFNLGGSTINVPVGNKKIIPQSISSSSRSVFYVSNGITFSNAKLSLTVIDLTTMFGTAIADYVYSLEQTTEGSGIAWLQKYGFFAKDYYEYCEPTMRSVEGLVSHDMVWFNLWDEVWEIGGYSGDGTKNNNTDRIRCKNKIPVFPDTTYQLTFPSGMAMNLICFYDANENFISYAAKASSGTITTPSNARYMTFQMNPAYGKAYKNDICVNLSWSGTSNGEYEPYEKASYPLDSSLTLRGIPKLDSQNNLYYDGDTYEPDGTVTRRYGIVDLGTLTWNYNTPNQQFYASLSGIHTGYPVNSVPPAFSTKYPAGRIGSAYAIENAINTGTSGGVSNTTIIIMDSAYTDAATFKAAMSGVYLIYELATETTETADPFVDPQRVNDWGTEEYVCESESDFIVPVGHDTKYRVNLRDKLQHLPDMADNDGYYLIQQAGSKMSLVNFRIPQAPQSDGVYLLKATVSGGVPTYTWEAVVESTATEVTG